MKQNTFRHQLLFLGNSSNSSNSQFPLMGNAYVVPANLILTVVYLPSLDSLERHFKGPAYLPKSHLFFIEEMGMMKVISPCSSIVKFSSTMIRTEFPSYTQCILMSSAIYKMCQQTLMKLTLALVLLS